MGFSRATLLLLAVVVLQMAAAKRDHGELWESYKARHGKQYSSTTREEARKSHFKRAHAVIEDHNVNPDRSFDCDHNDLSDRSPDELQGLLGELPSPQGDRAEGLAEVEYTNRAAVLPTSYDLRTSTACVGPIKDQKQCGSCWAFSAVATMEYSQCNLTRKFVALSEQMLIDCDTADLACSGGYPTYTSTWPWLKSNNKGVSTQASYPYTGVQGTCKYNANSLGVKGVNTYGGPVASDVTSIKNAILAYGLLRASVYVADNPFYYYKSGVYTTTACNGLAYAKTNHAVNLVGWTTVSGTPVWIMRNSWGTTWGNAGYMYIKSGVNLCNIESKVGWVKVTV